MKRNLPQISNTGLESFEQRLNIGAELINRNETDNEELYFYFMCGKRAYYDERNNDAKIYFDKVINHFNESNSYDWFKIKLGKKVPYDELINSLLLRGNLSHLNNCLEEAIDDYSNCINLDHSYIIAYRNRAICHIQRRNFLLAIKDLEYIIKIKEFYPEIYQLLSDCYKNIYDKNKSEYYHQFFLSQEPTKP